MLRKLRKNENSSPIEPPAWKKDESKNFLERIPFFSGFQKQFYSTSIFLFKFILFFK
jgi:hypothetical protein